LCSERFPFLPADSVIPNAAQLRAFFPPVVCSAPPFFLFLHPCPLTALLSFFKYSFYPCRRLSPPVAIVIDNPAFARPARSPSLLPGRVSERFGFLAVIKRGSFPRGGDFLVHCRSQSLATYPWSTGKRCSLTSHMVETKTTSNTQKKPIQEETAPPPPPNL